MLVIHIDTMEDTSFLKKVYNGLTCKVLYNPGSRAEIVQALEQEHDLVLLMGHGTPQGLLNREMNGYCVDHSMADLLKGKRCVGIWCYAVEFARREGLEGFFSSMFVSNATEAAYFGFDADDRETFGEVVRFATHVNDLLRSATPLVQWVPSLRQGAHLEKDYVRFNYDGLAYLGR